jgi:hypothetical protein
MIRAMPKEVVCRHCLKSFVPVPGKPGYVNECLVCLHEKTQPLLPRTDPLAGLLGLARQSESVHDLERRAGVLQRALQKLGASNEEIGVIVKAFRDAGMACFAPDNSPSTQH